MRNSYSLRNPRMMRCSGAERECISEHEVSLHPCRLDGVSIARRVQFHRTLLVTNRHVHGENGRCAALRSTTTAVQLFGTEFVSETDLPGFLLGALVHAPVKCVLASIGVFLSRCDWEDFVGLLRTRRSRGSRDCTRVCTHLSPAVSVRTLLVT